jgi:hypothetical protein
MSKHTPGPLKAALLATVLATLGTTVAAQESIHVKTATPFPSTITRVPMLDELARRSAAKTAEIAKQDMVRPQYAIIRREQGWTLGTAREATPGKEPETVVIKFGAGGRMDAHYQLYTDYRRARTKVEVRGPCYSACTLVLAYVEDICIAEGGFMAFHAVRSKETGVRMDWETRMAYSSMPTAIRGWIDSNGGADKLPLDGFWTLHDRQLWQMGYPKCTP